MELEGRLADMELVSKFDVGDIGIEALLFQTGYLTIAEELAIAEDGGGRTLSPSTIPIVRSGSA